MKKINFPDRTLWPELCRRPGFDLEQTSRDVSAILANVREKGDAALKYYTKLFDGADISCFEVSDQELRAAEAQVPDELKQALESARQNISAFHAAEELNESVLETTPGIRCWRKTIPIDSVGLYAPGGSFPLFSTVLMLAEPARVAECSERILCSPPRPDGSLCPYVLYAAKLCRATRIFKVGGAQALAALAYGTQSMPSVNKIFGPGNRYVTAAKLLLLSQGYACDLPAGPSELLIIADSSANPAFVAAELLAQAEHGVDSQVVLLSDSSESLNAALSQVSRQVAQFSDNINLTKAISQSLMICLRDLEEAVEFSNCYAPEHLLLAVKDPETLAKNVRNAGAVFLGEYSSVVAGDYASGPNHTLPTAGFARAYSGLTLSSFMKSMSFQAASRQGLAILANSIVCMASYEGLRAHAKAVRIRTEGQL